jgi:ribosomal protein S18 acetylase RimI-like enzyme
MEVIKMKPYPLSLRGNDDMLEMYKLAVETAPDNLHVVDLPYRLSSWSLDEQDNVRLWFDEQKLVGWAALQTPFWTIDYVCHPSVERELHSEILDWAHGHAQAILDTPYGHPAWFAMVFDHQSERIHDLERVGFACQADVGENSWSKVLMRRSISEPVKVYQPPAGFTVRSLKGQEEVEEYVELHRSVFGSRNMTAEWRQRTLEHPAYRNELDVVVESPDGQLVAFCVCWLDEATGAGHVEPLGCHHDFRKYALGRVALSHGLHRLQCLGAQNIFVETDSYRNTAFRLYESFDFEVIHNVLVYRKDYAE